MPVKHPAKNIFHKISQPNSATRESKYPSIGPKNTLFTGGSSLFNYANSNAPRYANVLHTAAHILICPSRQQSANFIVACPRHPSAGAGKFFPMIAFPIIYKYARTDPCPCFRNHTKAQKNQALSPKKYFRAEGLICFYKASEIIKTRHRKRRLVCIS